MTALQTVAEQIHIFGTYVTSYKEEQNTYTDVYRIDHASKASIKYKGNHEVISVTFSRQAVREWSYGFKPHHSYEAP